MPLTLPYPKHLGAAYRANTLNCRLPVLHGYVPGISHFPFGTAFHAVSLRHVTLLSNLCVKINYALVQCQYVIRLKSRANSIDSS